MAVDLLGEYVEVHIADVTRFVRPGTALDREAGSDVQRPAGNLLANSLMHSLGMNLTSSYDFAGSCSATSGQLYLNLRGSCACAIAIEG